MNSIDAQQPEKNHEDLSGEKAIKKMKELVEKTNTCFFSTYANHSEPMPTRPMSVQKFDEQGNLWFLSADDSHKNFELKTDNTVQLHFMGSAHSDFLTVYGKATISKDKEKIKELWEPIVKTWFTEGVDDPRITVIKVEPIDAYYWDNKHGNAIALIKMAAGAVMGKTLDDSIQGELKV
jgi:general stress protein 26